MKANGSQLIDIKQVLQTGEPLIMTEEFPGMMEDESLVVIYNEGEGISASVITEDNFPIIWRMYLENLNEREKVIFEGFIMKGPIPHIDERKITIKQFSRLLGETPAKSWEEAWACHLGYISIFAVDEDLMEEIRVRTCAEQIGTQQGMIQRGRMGQWDVYFILLSMDPYFNNRSIAGVSKAETEILRKKREGNPIPEEEPLVRTIHGRCCCGWQGTETYAIDYPEDRPTAEEILYEKHSEEKPHCCRIPTIS